LPPDGTVITGEAADVTPPSTSFAPSPLPARRPVTRQLVPLVVVPSCFTWPQATSASRTCRGVAAGFCWRYSAAAEATSGAAIDVPLFAVVAVSLVQVADTASVPGAGAVQRQIACRG
jgi:hypothetical protein